HPDKRRSGGHGPTLADEVEHLLPTPRTTDANGIGTHGTGGPDPRTTVSLLPTPRASDGEKGGPNQRGPSGDLKLPSAAARLPPTPDAAHGRKTTRTGPLLAGAAEKLKLLPTPIATAPSTANHKPDGTPHGGDYGPTLLDAVRLPPTPTAAD